MTELRHRQFAAPSLRRWRSFPLRVRRSKPGCSWYAGREYESRAPARFHVPPADRAGYPSRPGSGHAKTHLAEKIHADAAAGPFPGWYGPVPRAWSKGVSRVRAGSRRRSTSLHAAVPTKDARFQRACAKGAQPSFKSRSESASRGSNPPGAANTILRKSFVKSLNERDVAFVVGPG